MSYALVVILDSIVVLLALILNPMARRRRARAAETATGTETVQANSAAAPEESEILDRIHTRGATDVDGASMSSSIRIISRGSFERHHSGSMPRVAPDEEKRISASSATS